MQQTNYTGWDIGGAHLKVASVEANGNVVFVNQYATPLWQGLDCLEQALPEAMHSLPASTGRHAITMTAELVDIFADRQQGIASLSRLCREQLGDDCELYASQKGFLNINEPVSQALDVASANWHATAELVANRIDSGLFIDIGSTTTDIIPVANGQVMSVGFDDQSRLQHDEMVYTGVVRTPLMALAQRIPMAGHWQGIAAEQFATTADCYRVLGLLDERDDLMPTADGAAKDVASSLRRLARMAGADAGQGSHEPWIELARFFAEAQLRLITDTVQRVWSRHPGNSKTIVAAGAGRFLVKSLAERLSCDYLEFSDLVGCDAKLASACNVCAPAVALAHLHRLRHHP